MRRRSTCCAPASGSGRDRCKAVLAERLRQLKAALEAATALDTFVRIADRADEVGLHVARNVRRFSWLLQ
jgi:hypothetical protein